MQDIFFKVFRWLISAAQVKFVAFTSLFGIVSYFINILSGYLEPYLSTTSLNTAFLGLTPETWYFINLFNMAFGIPLVIGAFIVRFLIRRIPFIG